MAVAIPIGHSRVNPNTFMHEVWDGTKWDDGSGVATISKPFSHSINGGNITTGTITTSSLNGSSYSSRPTFSPTEREMMFQFLKDNLRVAEYVDENGKITTVQLEMRAGEGYVWENIRRVRTKDPL